MDKKALSKKVDRYVALRPVVNEFKQLGKEIAEDLQNGKVDSFTTPAGNTAKFEPKPCYEWVLESLKKIFSGKLLDTLCPRKPDAKKLNARLAGTPEDKALAKCRMPKPPKKALRILAAGETDTGDDEDD